MLRISSSRSDRLIATSLGLGRHGASWGMSMSTRYLARRGA
jgi:hypothetical protein